MKNLLKLCIVALLVMISAKEVSAQHLKPFTEVVIGGSVSPWQRLNTASASLHQPEVSMFVESHLNFLPLSFGVTAQGLGAFSFDPYKLNQRKLGGYLRYQVNLGLFKKMSTYLSAKVQYHVIESTLSADPTSGVPNVSIGKERVTTQGYMITGSIGTYLGKARVELGINLSQNQSAEFLIGDFTSRSMDLSSQSISLSVGIPIAIGSGQLICPVFKK